ncbi:MULTISPECIES: oligosaccharide flippase family protein [unclassified Pseudoalteromonas]|uniref:oligosaccharide flippase family protein n=1 Tax=unclassified Pseudoalteromonas TaxID=194690 RepID=UPI0013FE1607|nr:MULTISPECIES: oligosaccharide flippase family protein [unclassified Pseudoalteromonas]
MNSLKTSTFLMLERYIKVASGAVYILLLAKFLGPELYGLYSANLAVAGFLGVFSLAGIDGLFQKRLSESNNPSEVFFSFFAIKFIPLIIIISLYYSWSHFFSEDPRELLIYFLPFTISMMMSFSYQGLLYFEDYSKIFIVSFGVIIVSNLFRLYIFQTEISIEFFILSYSIEALAFPLGYSCFFILKNKQFIIPKIKVIKGILSDGWYLIISTIIIGAVSKVSLLWLEKNSTLDQVGKLALSLRVLDASLILAVATSMMGLRLLLKSYNTDYYIIKKNEYLKRMYFLSTLATLVIFVFFYYFAPLFFGVDYAYDLETSLYISFLVFFNFLGIYNGRLLVVEGLYHFALIRNTIGLILFVCFCFLYSDRFDIKMAVGGLLMFWFFSSFVFMVLFKRTRRMVFLEC